MPVETFAVRSIGFESERPIKPSAPSRADIACFVGFVSRREGALAPSLERWLRERGWIEGVYRRNTARDLLDVPVPIDTWDGFDRLFAWDERPGDGEKFVTALGAAVRSFFAEGGRKCYVVRVGDALEAR